MSALDQIVGQSLTNETASIVLNADGTATGMINGNALALTWTEQNGQFCRQGTLGSTEISAACQTVVIDGNMVSFVNADGQVSSIYQIN